MASHVEDRAPLFPGLRPFGENEGEAFFGRDREISTVTSLIIADGYVVLHGRSGVGKTSFIHAGLVPAVRGSGCDVLPVVRYAARSTGDPLVSPDFESSGGRRILVVDHAEELFWKDRARASDREAFLDEIWQAMQDDRRMSVLFSLREDYVARLDEIADVFPNRMRVRFRLSPLGRPAALEALTRPLERHGYAFVDDAAEQLIKMLADDEDLVEPPMLQVAMTGIVRALQARGQTRIDSQFVGMHGGVDHALASFYDSTIRAVAASRECVRRSSGT